MNIRLEIIALHIIFFNILTFSTDAFRVNKPKRITQILKSNHNPLKITDEPFVDITYYRNLYSNCLVHVINYRNKNLVISNRYFTPIVISNYFIVKVGYKIDTAHHTTEYELQANVFQRNINSNTKTQNILLCNNLLFENRCNDLSFYDKSSKMKSWTCEAHLYLNPPTYIEDQTFYEWHELPMKSLFLIVPGSFKRFMFDIPQTFPDNIDPLFYKGSKFGPEELLVTRQQFHVLVMDNIDNRDKQNVVVGWANSLTIYRDGANKGDYNHTTVNLNLLVHVRNEKSLLWICRDCTESAIYDFIKITPSSNLNHILESIKSTNILSVGKNCWQVGMSLEYANALRKLSDDKLPKSEYISFLKFYKVTKNKYDIDSVRFQTEAHLLNTAFRNLTDRTINLIERDFAFGSNKYQKQLCKIRPSNFYPGFFLGNLGKRDSAHFSFHPSTLKFVSCGNTSLTGIVPAFVQIVSIFQPTLWLCIAASFIILAIFVHSKLLSNKTRVNNAAFLSLFKILVEQGDPIRESLLLHSPATRIIFGIALFVGCVLSSLFKNENITQITLPRQPKVLFNTLESLIENDFRIYTRGTLFGTADLRISTILATAPILRNFLGLVEPSGNYSDHDISNLFFSELYTYAKSENSWFNFLTWLTPADRNFSDNAIRLMKYTKLLPNWMKALLNYNEVDKSLMENCNKTAVLLPDLTAHAYFYDLKKQKKSTFLGNDVKLSMSRGIKFGRRVNPQILERMKGLYSAGLWDWWNGMLVDFMPRIQGGFLKDGIQPVKASDMDGNIVVVFVIFCVGILTGILTFILETKVLGWTTKWLLNVIKGCCKRARICYNTEYTVN